MVLKRPFDCIFLTSAGRAFQSVIALTVNDSPRSNSRPNDILRSLGSSLRKKSEQKSECAVDNNLSKDSNISRSRYVVKSFSISRRTSGDTYDSRILWM